MNKIIRSPRGKELSCKGWQQEAAMRMLMNNLDPEVAENPAELIVYGGNGKAARNWESYEAIIRELKQLENDETLLVQSGKPVGVIRTHEYSPTVLIANSNLVPNWATWEKFRELEKKGLIMFGQMTAGSWIYIGTQGVLQGTYETFAEVARQNGDKDLTGKMVVTAGLGGMGGAQPLSVTMNNGVALCIEVDEARIKKRIEFKFLDKMATSLNEAMDLCNGAVREKRPLSVGLLGNAADILPEMVAKNIIPDIVTDQTSAHDELSGYVPNGLSFNDALKMRKDNPDLYIQKSYKAMANHCQAMLDMQEKGAVVFDYVRPLFCEGKGPFRWVALSGDPKDIARTDDLILEMFPENESLIRWIKIAREKIVFQGLPARICWLGYGERAKMGMAINALVRSGEISAPIVIGRDHLDAGSVASPNRETEAMKDGSDAISDWPLLNAMSNIASGASWVSFHHGGGVGMGYAQHAGQVIVADGSEMMDKRIKAVLTNDPGMGIYRHADAGYEIAIDFAKKHDIKIPML